MFSLFSQEVAGNGKFFFPNSGTYDGDYKEWVVADEDAEEAGEEAEAKPPPRRVRHGKGTYSERGNTYTGEWEDDKMHGKGKFNYASKAEYDGDWVANQYQGTGKYTWPDGSSYEVSLVFGLGDIEGGCSSTNEPFFEFGPSVLGVEEILTVAPLACCIVSFVVNTGELGGEHPARRRNLHRR